MKIVGVIALEAGRAAVAAVQRFNRKMSPRELKEDFARWDHNHYPSGLDGRCSVCGAFGAARDAQCPGTPDQQRARAELLAGDVHLHARVRR
jgi:hypothetical protein